MPDKIEILESLEADAAEILCLQYAAYQSEAELNNDFTIQPLMQTPDELIAEYRKGVILKAVRNGEIVGSVRAYAEGDTVYIGKLMVRPDCQGKGLGKRLLAAMESKLSKKRFELFTSGKSERNLYLYEKAGYKRFKEGTDKSGITFVYFEKKADASAGIALGMCFGAAVGVVIGTFTDNIGIWIPIGAAIGLAIGASFPLLKNGREK